MDFFDKLGKKASETYKYTAEKTSKIAKEAKLKMAINENKSKIEELYEEIGKKVYMFHINNKDNIDMDLESALEEYCIQIDEICDEIEDERKELLTLKDKKQCPNCFDEIELACNYCPNCGYEQTNVDEENFSENNDNIIEEIEEQQEKIDKNLSNEEE